jgi:hypothetical protein
LYPESAHGSANQGGTADKFLFVLGRCIFLLGAFYFEIQTTLKRGKQYGASYKTMAILLFIAKIVL